MPLGSVRDFAKALGLRCLNYDVTGPLKFPKASLVFSMWQEFDEVYRGGGSFEQIRVVVAKFGPSIWRKGNEVDLLVPQKGIASPRALRWAQDKGRIITIFQAMSKRRARQDASMKKHRARRNEARCLIRSPSPSKYSSTARETTEKGITKTPCLIIKLRSGREIGSGHIQPAPNTKMHSAEPEQAVHFGRGVNATSLWMMTPDGLYSAHVCLAPHTKMKDFFQAVVTAFEEQSTHFPTPSRLQKLIVSFTNLGSAFQNPRILTINNDDTQFKQLQNDINGGFDRHRHSDEKVIGLATAIFELEDFGLMDNID